MTAPIALTVHPGGGIPPEWRRQLIVDWLAANSIDPKRVSADHPVIVVDLPQDPSEAPGEATQSMQVIVYTEYHRADGAIQAHPTTGRPIASQRTVPLTAPFPPDPTTDGEERGQDDRQTAQEAPEVLVRPARKAEVPHTGQVSRQERAGEGGAKRIEEQPEEDPRQGHQEVPQPQEDRRRPEEEEVTE